MDLLILTRKLFYSARCMMEGSVIARPFVKAALFTQVLKTSVALSIIEVCPNNVNIEDFVIHLHNVHESFENYRHACFYQSEKIRNSTQTRVLNFGVDNSESLREILSHLCKNVTSTRIGFLGLLISNNQFSENLLLPGLTFAFQALAWTNKCSESLEELDLLHQASVLHNEANDSMKVAAELIAKLDLAEQPTTDSANCIAAILDLTCNNQEDIYFCWLRPLKTLFSVYVRCILHDEDLHIPNFANFLCRHLLIRYCKLFRNLNPEMDFANESIARIYSLLTPLLCLYKRKLEMSKELIETTQRSIETIQRLDFKKTDELVLSNGAIGLLNDLKTKLQRLQDIPN